MVSASEALAPEHEQQTTYRMRRALFVTTALISAGIALAVEPVARKHLSGSNEIDLGVVRLRLAYNSGVAFSLGNQLPSAVIIAFTALATIGIAVYAWRSVPQSRGVAVIGFALIVAGAASNVVDRALDGKVTDYFHTGWWPTFNLADTYLTCGFILVVVSLLVESSCGSEPEIQRPQSV
ncbi:putative lipoprotein signal peptidase (plasmid) [Rhodococcus erythropolis]|uniref:Lipoprotein signal peptidase n=1 Tax=Rhodococcus erythropolis TaxID=1833 RepID=A0A6G9D372_RHOER|nr:putative lipoprotein signal peptidase [Rhodococcus erythropolis]